MSTPTIQTTKLGTAVSGFMIWTSRKEAEAYAKAQGWNKNDVRPAYHKNFGWKGYIVGQLISTTEFRGFAKDDTLVTGEVLPPNFTGR